MKKFILVIVFLFPSFLYSQYTGGMGDGYSSAELKKSPEMKIILLKVLIQGFYNPQSITMVKDTVTLFLCDTTAPHSKIDSASAYLDSTGVGRFRFGNFIFGSNYYLVVKHRNSIETWSKPGGERVTMLQLNYDLTFSSSQAYGNNMIQINFFKWTIYSGDVNQDGTVDATDLSLIDNDAYNFTTGYVNTDITGDDIVDASDAALADNNAYNFVSVIRP